MVVESHLKKAVLEEVAASYLMKKGINGAALRGRKQIGIVNKQIRVHGLRPGPRVSHFKGQHDPRICLYKAKLN